MKKKNRFEPHVVYFFNFADTVVMTTENQRPRFNFARLAESATKDATDVTSPKRTGNDEAQVFSHAMAHVVSGIR